MQPALRAKIMAALTAGMQPLEVARTFGVSLLRIAEMVVAWPGRRPTARAVEFELSSARSLGGE